jgi:hypothetical protein
MDFLEVIVAQTASLTVIVFVTWMKRLAEGTVFSIKSMSEVNLLTA